MAFFAALVACGPRDRRFDPSHFVDAGAGAPPEVVVPANTLPGAHLYGIVTSKPSDSSMCCAASAHVDLPVRKPTASRKLQIGLYTPRGVRQRLRVRFPTGDVVTQFAPHDQFSVLTFAVPSKLCPVRGIVRVRVDASDAPYTLTAVYFE
jgi:hypothetical protein